MFPANARSLFHGRFGMLQANFSRIKYGWLALLCVVVMSFSLPAIAANPTAQNRAIAREFATAGWGTNPHWEQTWDRLVSPKFIQHFNSTTPEIVGLEANKSFNQSLFQGFPDIQQNIEDLLAEGDKVVYRTTLQGTNTGTFLGTPATGKTVKVNDFTMLRIANGQIVELWYETNLLEVMQQLGVIPR